jgi:hypothetical protein
VASIERLEAPGGADLARPRGKERGTRRLRVINDERTAMRLLGYDPGFIAKHTGGAQRESRSS